MTSENPTSDNHPSDDADNTTTQNGQAASQLPPTARIPPVQSPPAPHNYQITCKTEKDWRDKIKFGAEMVGVAFLIAYTVFAGQQVCQMRRANKIAHDALVASQRPWVTMTDVTFSNPPKFTAAGPQFATQMSLDVSSVLRNVGLSAATKVYPEVLMVPTDKPGFPTEPMPCPTVIEKSRIEFPPNAIFLMPQDKLPYSETTSTNPERGGFLKIKNIWSIWVKVCISYQDTFGNVYQTKMTYHSMTRDDSVPLVAVPGRDLTYKPIIGWNLRSTEVSP